MENLFKLGEAKRDYLDQMRCSKVTADYCRYFIDLLLPTIIEDSVNKIRLVDIPKADVDEHRLPIRGRIMIRKSEDKDEQPHIGKGEDYYSLYISNNRFKEFKNKCHLFFAKNDIPCHIYHTDDPQALMMGFETDALTLGKAIEREQDRYRAQKDPTVEIKKPLEFADQQIGFLSTVFVDKVCDELFENEFLDKMIVSTYKEGLSLIDYRLRDSLKNGATGVTRNLSIGTSKRSYLVVPEEYLDSLSYLVDDFMKRYNLGSAKRWAYETDISIDTKLSQLRDAYYMEKQRIEQSLTPEAYQYQMKK